MGLSQALYSGMSGLITHNRCMDNIGNNLANVNTTGFKKGDFQFSTLLEQSYRGGMGPSSSGNRGSVNPVTLGLGVTTGSIDKDFTQGPLETTGNPNHMAIEGNGFFVLQNGNYNVYTRDGTFNLGQIVAGSGLKQTILMNDNSGMPVLGYRADENGNIPDSATLDTLPIERGSVGGARATTTLSIGGNIDKSQPVTLGTRIVGPSLTNPPSWLGRDLVTADDTWPALNAAAAAGTPSLINGGNVSTSAPMGRLVWTVPLDASGNRVTDPSQIYRQYVSIDAAQAADPSVAYYEVRSGVSETTDKAALVASLNTADERSRAALQGLDTNLRDVFYYNGGSWVQPFAGIKNGDEVSMKYNLGTGTSPRTVTTTFTYNNPDELPATLDPAKSSTLRDWMTFLTGGVDSPTKVEDPANPNYDPSGVENQRLTGGAMATIKLSPNISGTDGGTDLYTTAAESAGAYTRVGYDQIAYNTNDPLSPTFNLSIVSNLGAANAISGMEVSFNSVRYDGFFADDKVYNDKTGGGAATEVSVYDSVGEKFSANMRLTLIGRDGNFSTYRWYTDSADDTDNAWGSNAEGNINTNAATGTGLIRFDADGKIVLSMSTSETGGITVDRDNSGTRNPIVIPLVNGAPSDYQQPLDFRKLTQMAGNETEIGITEQDGRPAGTLESFVVAYDGTIEGMYSNGVTLTLGRIALAMVPNETGLIAAGGNIYYESAASGMAVAGKATTGGRGQINQYQLETSNVELAEEFTKLITTERGFQANARTITTVDEMLTEIVNLKR